MARFVKFHFGWKGRLNRLNYLLTEIMWLFIIGIFAFPSTFLFPLYGETTITVIVGGICFLLLGWTGTTSTIKRLHDLNKSGRRLFPPAIVLVIGAIISLISLGAFFALLFILRPIAILISIIFLLYLHCTNGTEGENQFGKDPKDELTEDVLLGRHTWQTS